MKKVSKKREAKILRKAADTIDTHGWTGGLMHSERGYCALGAISAVAKVSSLPMLSWKFVPRFAAHIEETQGGRAIWAWNDDLECAHRMRLIFGEESSEFVNPVTQEMRSFALSLDADNKSKPKRIKRAKDLVIAALIK